MRKNSDWEPSTKDVSQNNSIPWAKKNRIEKPYFNFHDEAPKFSLLLNMIEWSLFIICALTPLRFSFALNFAFFI